jgi:hypothetical protein
LARLQHEANALGTKIMLIQVLMALVDTGEYEFIGEEKQ